MNEKIGSFEIGAFFGEVLDGIPAVAQDPGVAVDESNFADAGSGVVKGRIVTHHAEIGGVNFDLAQIGGADRVIDDGNLVIFAGAIVGDGQRFAGYSGTLWISGLSG